MVLSTKSTGTVPERALLPLENGDCLSRAEFERRFQAMPAMKKAELIEGVVFVPSPVRHHEHGRPHIHIAAWLGQYEAGTPGVEASDNSTVRLDLDNEPQPDVLLCITPERGGQTRLSADGYIEGAPELVIEIASSSASYDLHAKLHAYRRNGVQEYIVWRVLERDIDWFVLREGQYERLQPDSDGRCRSAVFGGLWLDPAALIRGDMQTVFATGQQGLASAEHAAFVTRLQPPEATPEA
jgi:Uma2 family endonuclease